MKRVMSIIFLIYILVIIGIYVAYAYVNSQFIWISGLLLLGGISFNWYLYNKYLINKK